MSFPNCCEPWLVFLFTTQYQYIQALIDFICSFLDWYHHLCHLSSHQALPPTRSPRPHSTFEMDQILQHTKRYEDVTQIFIFSVYTVVANARL